MPILKQQNRVIVLFLAPMLLAFFGFSPDRKEMDPCQVPIYFSACTEAPLLKINIEGMECTLKIDLGAACDLMLKRKILDQLQDKTPVDVSRGIDIQGHQYNLPQFMISNIQLGNFKIDHVTAIEEDDFFIAQGHGKKNEMIDGRIGCTLFHSSVCFFDLSHSVFSIGVDIEDVKKSHSLDGFMEAFFEFKKGLIFIDFMTDQGNKKFILDTGASHSAVRRSSFIHRDGSTQLKISHFQLGEKDLGPWSFYLLDFPDRFDNIDGILGMDFFKDHALCLNFKNKKIFLKQRRCR